MAHDTVYHAARLIHSLASNLKGDQRTKNNTTQATKDDPLKEELVP